MGRLDEDADRARGQARQQVGICDRREVDPPGAVEPTVREAGSGLNGEPGLAAAAGAGQGDQPLLAQESLDRGQLVAAADEAGELGRQIVGEYVERPWRRKVLT